MTYSCVQREKVGKKMDEERERERERERITGTV